ncbi:integrase [Photobacterium leiognathi]|uniref:tyrosine-type recombinase/integrase n=1 Tax=Photobacterium leiognathi TaxID=553611 RepID=UPI001EDED29D|nr:tyrosine-type recombinase/integrase [Photobacterium leiognathi]MCG3885104.1 integrase [Photobacterium leiognathi]
MCNRKEWEPPSDKHLCSFLKKGLAKGKNIPTSLRQFCKTAIYTTEHQEHVELSQALVECQIGRVKTYGLPLDNLARLSLSSVNSLSNFEFYASSAKITGNKSSNSNVNTISNKDLFTKLKQCFSKTKVNNNKLSRQVVSRRLQNLVDNGPYTIGESLLLKWFIQKSQVCSPSSLMQYHCSLSRRWLYMTEDCDFSYLDSELLEQMYTSIIGKIEKPGSRKYFIARLKDIHQFGSLLNHLPNISSQFFEQDISQHHTRAGFIDEALFNALLNHIDCLIDLNDDEKCCLKSLCIISYRCGLRLSELQKLQLCNIEVSDIGWIDIRNNRFGSNKTASSLRKVPLFPLLLEHEKTIIESHLSQQRLLHPAPNSLVFSLGLNPYQLFDAGDVSIFVGETLKALSGLNHLVFHHLRHSCCSQLQLIFELNQELDERPTLCPYTSVQRSKIKQLLKGESLQKGYFAIASLVGHESPEMTFAHYFHFSDLIAHLKVKRSVNALTRQQKVKLGISTRQKKYASEQEHTHCLIQKLKIKPLSSKITNHRPQKAIISKTKTTSSLQLCYRVLLEYQQGLSLKEITNKYYISQEDVDKWITNAYYIKSLKTNNIPPRSRHFSKARSLLILPAPLQSNAEIILVDKLIVGIREHYINNKDNIKTMLDYALKNTCVSKSGIYFNDPMILETFIKTFACIVPKSSWRAITHYHQHSDVLEKWRSVLKGVKKKVGRKSKGTMRTQGAVRLEYISPIERNIKNKGGYKKYSTHTLIYLFHIMAIMMLNLPTKSNTRILTKKKTYVPNALLKL